MENLTSERFYYQDATGNTSHLSDSHGNLLESYRYSAFGQPSFYDASGTSIGGSNYDSRHLFQGELWTPQTGLNDHRNRQALPAMGTFLQPDPIGFAGDPANVYRYCGNNPVNAVDLYGLWAIQLGYSFNVQIGPFSGAISGGLAFDGRGNIGLYRSFFTGGAPIGADVAFTQGGMWSVNADSIYDLRGPFYEGSGTAGDEIAGTVVRFSGEANNGQPVDGWGFFMGAGAGGGWAFGKSDTMVSGINIFTGQRNIDPRDMPAPGGTTWVDPSGCVAPECVTMERITVTGTPTSEPPSGMTHVGTNGTIINGPAFTVLPLPNLLLFGGGPDWQGISPGWANFPGPQPGEGTHPVSFDLY